MRFDDEGYIKAYLEKGSFPRIHDDIASLAAGVDAENVLDLGCCTGLLSCQLGQWFTKVIGIEANKSYADRAVTRDNTKVINMTVDMEHLIDLKNVILENQITAVFARRVFPELYDTGSMELVDNVVRLFAECGINTIVTEGRIVTRNHKNALYSVGEEVKSITKTGLYELKSTHKNCAVLSLK